MSDLCQNTIVPDVHWQQWDRSQGLAKEEEFSVNFPANSFYSLSLIFKGSNFCVFLPENWDSVCFSSAQHFQVTLPDNEWLSDLSLSHDPSLGNLMVLSSGQIVQQRCQQKQCYYPGTLTLCFVWTLTVGSHLLCKWLWSQGTWFLACLGTVPTEMWLLSMPHRPDVWCPKFSSVLNDI